MVGNVRGEMRERRLRMPSMVFLAVDAMAWTVGVLAAMALRFDFMLDAWRSWTPAAAVAVAVVAQAAAGSIAGLYGGRWRRASLDEGLALARAMSVTCAVLLIANHVAANGRFVPTSVVLASAPAAFCAAGAARFLERLLVLHRGRQVPNGAVPVLVFGAGDGGYRVIDSMQSDPEGRYTPVGLVDDDPQKRNLRVRGVPVMGGRERLDGIVASTRVELLIVASPSISSDSLRDLSRRALDADIGLRVVPPVSELIDGKVGADDVRPLTEADLLGRHQIDTDIDAIADYITGRRVLVTGAGGSIGSELCSQLHRFGPDALIMVDRDESALHARPDGDRRAGAARLRECFVVADIRDSRPDARGVPPPSPARRRLPRRRTQTSPPSGAAPRRGGQDQHHAARSTCSRRRPPIQGSIVSSTSRPTRPPIRAACWATRNASPSNSLRGTPTARTAFSSVCGSATCSVAVGRCWVPSRKQVAAGGPITVTHPDVTRYFMTVTEAVQLVVQAGAVGRDGEALVLDMGEPVKIDDVARRLVAQADRPIEIVYTGLRPGEKLHEVLLGQAERDQRDVHPLISHCAVPAQSPLGLEVLDITEVEDLRDEMINLCVIQLDSDATLQV